MPEEETPLTADQEGPLAGLRVLDFTTFLAGPFCTQILADLGAEVTKLESLQGDSSRAIPPHFVGGDSAYFLGNNRNKSSIAVNMKEPEGLAIALDLIEQSDVVIENYRPGVCEKLGLDIAKIRDDNPRLIWASISGFGQSGERSNRPAYDMIVQALSGVMSLTGERGQNSVRLGIPAGDLVAGLYAAIGILAALPKQAEHDQGRTLDISMLDGQLSMLSYQAVYGMFSGKAPQPQGSGHDSIPTYRSFVGGDHRQFVVTANTERMWQALCMVVGLTSLPTDVRFRDAASRLQNREALDELLEEAFLGRSAIEWVDLLSEAGVPAAPIKGVLEAVEDARQTDRDMVIKLVHPDGRNIEVLGNPVSYQESSRVMNRYPPRLGEDTDRVLEDRLARTTEQVAILRARGIIK